MPVQPRSGPIATQALFLLDAAFLVIACCAVVAVVGRGQSMGIAALTFPITDLLFLYALGLYRREAMVEMSETLGGVPTAAGVGGLTAWIVLEAPPSTISSPDAHPLFAASVPFFAAVGLAARLTLHLLRRRGAFRRRLLVIGAGRRAWDLIWMLRRKARTLAFDVVLMERAAMGEAAHA